MSFGFKQTNTDETRYKIKGFIRSGNLRKREKINTQSNLFFSLKLFWKKCIISIFIFLFRYLLMVTPLRWTFLVITNCYTWSPEVHYKRIPLYLLNNAFEISKLIPIHKCIFQIIENHEFNTISPHAQPKGSVGKRKCQGKLNLDYFCQICRLTFNI